MFSQTEQNFYDVKDVPNLRPMTDTEYKNFINGLNMLPANKEQGKWYDYWIPVHSNNFSKITGKRNIQGVVIHTTEGWKPPFSTFQDPTRKASSHYSVEKDGSVVYMVDENDISWHAGSSVNDWSIGIEVTGFAVQDNKSSHTNNKEPIGFGMTQMDALAKLVAGICKRHNIPIDRNHIFGHAHTGGCQKDPESAVKAQPGKPVLKGTAGGSSCHYDPGNQFPWDKFINMVWWHYYRWYVWGSVGLLTLTLGVGGYFFYKHQKQKKLTQKR